MKINFFKIFKKKNSIQAEFPLSGFQPLDVEKSIYPFFISLKDRGLLAYSSRFMVKSEDLQKVERLVEQCFHKFNVQEKECLYDHGKTLCYYRFDDLNLIAIDIITNDNCFIDKLSDLKIEPPSPDTVFPHLDLGTYGSLQGELEFWWDVYWEPFWNNLDEEGRNEYFKRNNLSPGAISFLLSHQR